MHCILAVAMHKQADVPHDPPYLPVQAGAALHPSLGVTGDHTGDNISTRNPLYSELTTREAMAAYAVHSLHEEAKSHFFHLLSCRVAADYEV